MMKQDSSFTGLQADVDFSQDGMGQWSASDYGGGYDASSAHPYGREGLAYSQDGEVYDPALAQLQQEMMAVRYAKLSIVGRDATLNALLLAHLRQHDMMQLEGSISQEGFFTLVTLPTLQPPATSEQGTSGLNRSGLVENDFSFGGYSGSFSGSLSSWQSGELNDLLASSHLVLYLVGPDEGWTDEDVRWYARLCSIGVPILPVILTKKRIQGAKRLRQQVRIPAIHLALQGAEKGQREKLLAQGRPLMGSNVYPLVKNILALCPNLAIPLAQEVPSCRTLIINGLIQSALRTRPKHEPEADEALGLGRATPADTLTFRYRRLVLQLAAIYGRPPLTRGSAEWQMVDWLHQMVSSVGGRLAKLPAMGWAIRGMLHRMSVRLMVRTLVSHYEKER